jgi:type II secretory pathway pseudopilin PulG
MMKIKPLRPGRGNDGGAAAPSLRREDGFTLAELLVTTLIMVILLIGLGGMISSGAKSSTASFNLVKMEDAANEAITTMTRQIRVGSSFDAASNNSQIIFQGDFNGDGNVGEYEMIIPQTQTFKVEEGVLFKDGQPWVEGVSGLTFTYYIYDTGTGKEKVLDPNDPDLPGWNYMIHRVAVTLDMSMDSMGITLSRSYHGSATIMNALR